MEGTKGQDIAIDEFVPSEHMVNLPSQHASDPDLETFQALNPPNEAEAEGFPMKGTPLVSKPSSISFICSSVFELSKPGPSRPIEMEHIQMHEIIESLDSIITSFPPSSFPSPIDVVPEPDPYLSGIPKSPAYNLRSLMNRPWRREAIGGLESNHVPFGPRKLRGRKSNLSKAQLKHKIDIADGKHRSLSGVLRAVQPPSQGYR